MAVLIRDLEMPEACINCILYNDYECSLTGRYLDDIFTVRPDWCPLEEVTLVTGMYKTQRKENVHGNLR